MIVKILAVLFGMILLTSVSMVFAETQLSKYGMDVFTDKQNYKAGETVKFGINIDPERFKIPTKVELQTWDALHQKHEFTVVPDKTYYFEYMPDKSFIGEVKVYATVKGFHDETFFFVGIPNPTIDDFRTDRTFGGDYYDQESNPEGYILLKDAEDQSETDWLFEALEKVKPVYQLDEPKTYAGISESEAMELLREKSEVKEDFDACGANVRDYQDTKMRSYLSSGGSAIGAEMVLGEKFDFFSMYRNCEIDSGLIHWNNAGVILGENGQYIKSIEYFDVVLDIRGNYVKALTNKATSLYNLGEISEAVETLKQTKQFSQSAIIDYIEASEELKPVGICGEGTVENEKGQCVPIQTTSQQQSRGGGCLIATAAYGSELAPQVQQLREIRDNSLLQTKSGSAFMESFNQFYYSFSPTIADWERQNPVFKEAVKHVITPLLVSLSILNYVDMDSEAKVLGYGISLILLNVGMYFVLPAVVIHRLRKFV